MKAIIRELTVSVTLTIALAVIVCGIYPIMTFAVAQGFFPHKANGSVVYHKNTAVGSELLAQPFKDQRYFHPRPSAAGKGYDAAASGGSNLGPTSSELAGRVQQLIAEYRKENNLPDNVRIPADAVTASASGLDPHISVANALLQAPRVAKARGVEVGYIEEEVRRHTTGRTFGVLGEARVNVLRINMDLDKRATGQ
jgi:K+-transporting ATPase ATPase C chain